MRLSKGTERASLFGVLSFLILISIGYLTTNELSRSVVEPVRYLSITIVIASLCLLLVKKRATHVLFVALASYFLLLTWGLLLSFLNGAIQIAASELFVNASVTASGLLLLCLLKEQALSPKVVRYYVVYALCGLIATIVIKGLDLTLPPHFNFDYVSDNSGQEILYSQGISKFFGYGAVAAIFLSEHSGNKVERPCALLLAIVFLMLSLIGGARGDSIFAVAVVFGFLALRHFLRTGLLVAFGAVALVSLVGDWSWINDLLIFQRLGEPDSDFGGRVLLLAQSMQLVSNEPRCLWLGCGFGYFQAYYGYDFGMYPHNFIAELVIAMGAPMATAFGFGVVRGVVAHIRSNSVDLLVLFFIYSLLLALKSGTLLSDWLLVACLIYFLTLAIRPRTARTLTIRPHQRKVSLSPQ